MRLLLNVIWLVFVGVWACIAWTLAALVMVIPIITIPFAIQAAKIAVFSLWPFGRTLVKRRDAGIPSLMATFSGSSSAVGGWRSSTSSRASSSA